VYLDAQSKYNVLVNQFRILPTGELSNDPPQTLTNITGVFQQINRKGVTKIRNEWTLYAFFSGRSTNPRTVEIFAESGYNKLVGTLTLNSTTDQFFWAEIPVQTTVLFFRISEGGKVLTENASSTLSSPEVNYGIVLDNRNFFTFPTDGIVTKTTAKYVTTSTIPPPPPVPPPPPFSSTFPPRTELNQGDTLPVGAYLISPNGAYAAIYQLDGNFVLRSSVGALLWSTNTSSSQPSQVEVYRYGCELRLINAQGKDYWTTNLGWAVRRLVVGDDGKLKLLKKTFVSKWSWSSGISWVEEWPVEWSVP
jgi:hypothetical protein